MVTFTNLTIIILRNGKKIYMHFSPVCNPTHFKQKNIFSKRKPAKFSTDNKSLQADSALNFNTKGMVIHKHYLAMPNNDLHFLV